MRVLSQVQASAERFPGPVPHLSYTHWFSKCVDLEMQSIAVQSHKVHGEAAEVEEAEDERGSVRGEQLHAPHPALQRESREVDQEEIAVQEVGMQWEEGVRAREVHHGVEQRHAPRNAAASVSSSLFAAVFIGEAALGVKLNEGEVIPRTGVQGVRPTAARFCFFFGWSPPRMPNARMPECLVCCEGVLQAQHAVLSMASVTRANVANELGLETWKTLTWAQVQYLTSLRLSAIRY